MQSGLNIGDQKGSGFGRSIANPEIVILPPLTNAVGRYIADSDKLTKDGADAVSQWNDLIGSNHLTQATGSKQPLWSDAQINGKAAILFSGNDMMDHATTVTVGAVVMIGNYTGSSPFATYNGAVTAGSTNIFIIGNSGTTDIYEGFNSFGASSTYIDGVNTKSYATLSDWKTCLVEGTPVSASGIDVGTDRGSGSRHWTGYMREIIIYNQALSTDEKTELAAYVAAEYGL